MTRLSEYLLNLNLRNQMVEFGKVVERSFFKQTKEGQYVLCHKQYKGSVKPRHFLARLKIASIFSDARSLLYSRHVTFETRFRAMSAIYKLRRYEKKRFGLSFIEKNLLEKFRWVKAEDYISQLGPIDKESIAFLYKDGRGLFKRDKVFAEKFTSSIRESSCLIKHVLMDKQAIAAIATNETWKER